MGRFLSERWGKGGFSDSNPVLKAYQGRAGVCLTTLFSAHSYFLALLNTNLAETSALTAAAGAFASELWNDLPPEIGHKVAMRRHSSSCLLFSEEPVFLRPADSNCNQSAPAECSSFSRWRKGHGRAEIPPEIPQPSVSWILLVGLTSHVSRCWFRPDRHLVFQQVKSGWGYDVYVEVWSRFNVKTFTSQAPNRLSITDRWDALLVKTLSVSASHSTNLLSALTSQSLNPTDKSKSARSSNSYKHKICFITVEKLLHSFSAHSQVGSFYFISTIDRWQPPTDKVSKFPNIFCGYGWLYLV